MHIAALNIAKGLYHKAQALEYLAKNYDIVGLNESDLQSPKLPPNFQEFHTPEVHYNKNATIRTLLYAKKYVTYQRISLNENEKDEYPPYVAIKLNCVTVIIIYNEHTKCAYKKGGGVRLYKEKMLTRLANFLKQAATLKGPIVILGDINLDYLRTKDATVSKYKTILNQLGLTQYIKRKTRGEACLDHVISNTENIHQIEVSEALLNTDHLVVSCKLGKNKENPEILIKQWLLSNKDASKMVIIGTEDKSVDSKIKNLVQQLREVTEKYFVPVKIKLTSKWYSTRQIRELKEKIVKEKEPQIKKKLKNRLTNMPRKAKKISKRKTKMLAIRIIYGA